MSVRESEARALASTSAPAPAEPLHHRKIAKAPNPLSVKKKKLVSFAPNAEKESVKAKTSSADSLKRRREANGPTGELQDDGNTLSEGKSDHPGTVSSGHKRKRRRKDKQV